MAASNKIKVKQAALHLFNQNGLLNVRLQHISDEAIVSVGNLTYHYRTKEHIVEALWEELLEKRNVLLAEFRVLPLFEDLERLLRSIFLLQQDYLFFYIDTPSIIQAFPAIAQAWQEHQAWQNATITMMINFNVSRGVFRPEPRPNYFVELAQVYSVLSDSWASQRRSKGLSEDNFADFRKAIWTFWSTIFTDQGWKEFDQLEAMIKEKLI